MLLTEEQEQVRAVAREFAQRSLAPYSAEWDREAKFPRSALRELGKLGFMGMTVPPEWDGAGADYVAYALALEEVAAGDGAVSTIMSGHNSVGCMPLVEYGTLEQKEKYLRPMARGELLSAFCLTEAAGGGVGAARLLPPGAAGRLGCQCNPYPCRASARNLYSQRNEAIYHVGQECRHCAGLCRD